MGNTNYRMAGVLAPPDPRGYLQADFPKFIFQGKIGNAKFMKTYHMKADGVALVLKVYMRLTDEDLAAVAARLTHLSKVLSPMKYPCLMPYQMWLKSSSRIGRNSPYSPVYLVRQHIKSSLYDRLATRPFLNKMEKLWLIYQLLRAVECVHEEDVIHGDIKPENIMVTSWNWLMLTDFASFKPLTIPDDDPTDFQYYFDVSERRRCYVAPERFVKRSSVKRAPDGMANTTTNATASSQSGADTFTDLRLLENDGVAFWASSSLCSDPYELSLLKAMDVFSLGCTIAEILLDGVPFIDLPGLLSYRSSTAIQRLDQEGSPVDVVMGRIKITELRDAIGQMTCLLPEARISAGDARNFLEAEGAFPSYFGSCLYDLFVALHWQGMLPDTRIDIISSHYATIMKELTGQEDSEGAQFFAACVTKTPKMSEGGESTQAGSKRGQASTAIPDAAALFALAEAPNTSTDGTNLPVGQSTSSPMKGREAMVKEIFSMGLPELMQRCEALTRSGHGGHSPPSDPTISHVPPAVGSNKGTGGSGAVPTFPDAMLLARKRHELISKSKSHPPSPGLVVVIEFICSNMRHLRYPQSKIVSLVLLLRMCACSDSEVILQRVLPFVLLCAEDAVPSVRAMTIRTLCGIISYVDKFLPYEADIFVRSILPVLNNLSKDSELCVRTAFAECMGKFAEYSMYFLDVSFTTQCAKVRSSGVSTVSAPTDLAPEELTSTSAPETPTVATESNSPEIESKLASLQTKYTSTLGELRAQFSRWVIGLLQDHSVMEHRAGSGLSSECSVLKRIVLSDLLRLCNFFGPEQSIELLLSQFLTFLNDQDWELRLAFCKTLPTFCAFVGQRITCDYIYPCMDNALVDIEVPVVAEALRAICSLIELDLLTKAVISNLVKSFSCLLIHPSECIRIQCVHMLVAAINAFGVVETQALLRPDLIPFLHTDILSVPVDVELLRLALIAPVSLHEFKAAIDLQRNSINEGSASEVIPSPSASNKETILSSESTQGGTDASISAVADSTAALSFSEETVSSTSEAPPPIPPAAGNSAALRSDASKIAIMSNYIKLAAYEINTKTLQWRNAGVSNAINRSSAIVAVHQATSLRSPAFEGNVEDVATKTHEDIMDSHSTALARSTVESLRVPHQKLSVGLGIPDDDRSLRSKASLFIEDPMLVAKVYGIKRSNIIPATADGTGGWYVDDETQGTNDASGVGAPSSVAAAMTAAPNVGAMARGQSVSRLNATPRARAAVASKPLLKRSSISFTLNSQSSSSTLRPRSELHATSEGPVDPTKSEFLETALSQLSGTDTLLRQIAALDIPPLPPQLGALKQPDGRDFSMFSDSLDLSSSLDPPQTKSTWRPRDNVQLASLTEHSLAVNRIAIAQDQSFFVSASADKTARVWQIPGLENNAYPRSALTYAMHTGKLTDVAMIENTHSVATSCTDGSIHIWRVDVSTRGSGSAGAQAVVGGGVGGGAVTNTAASSSVVPSQRSTLGVQGMSMVKTLASDEGPVVCMQHYSSDIASVLTYCTMRGGVRSWDLRCATEPFKLPIPAELGYSTSIALAPDRNWIAVGTSKGCVALWDIRYNVMSKLWQHSSASTIHRIATCKSIGSVNNSMTSREYPEGAYLFVAAGRNETGVWGVPEGGECIRCFRTLPPPPPDSAIPTGYYHAITPLPVLRDVPVPSSSHSRYFGVRTLPRESAIMEPSVRAIIGRISVSGTSYVVNAGTDKCIRFWDFNSPSKCYTVSGLDVAQPKPLYATPDVEGYRGNLFVCYDTAMPSLDNTLQSHIPLREGRGVAPQSGNVSFKSGVLDLKVLDLPTRLMLSAGRDGEIKIWK